ncbi:CLUMA_CG016579, isoform A [Clunio marinus]|uniref:CLUMA_CG016579, isoform A n=1 Tax=Clunio marinus TaxID=568069 RepID=A0A1J1IWS1_9DIPT|nr:CLUMA_CG016579, isoform A [Clunio marinus]
MKFLLLFVVAIAVTLASPERKEEVVTTQNGVGLGGYSFAYETKDGQVREEHGNMKNNETEDGVMYVRGTYSFVGDDGQTYTVSYIIDENGFQPSPPHIPKD